MQLGNLAPVTPFPFERPRHHPTALPGCRRCTQRVVRSFLRHVPNRTFRHSAGELRYFTSAATDSVCVTADAKITRHSAQAVRLQHVRVL